MCVIGYCIPRGIKLPKVFFLLHFPLKAMYWWLQWL